MINVWRIPLMLILSSCLVISCSKLASNEGSKLTPKDNAEAELIALCLSGNLVAPDSLYKQVLSHLATIRSTFGNNYECLNRITFVPPWRVGRLIIGLDDTTAQKVANAEYQAWDELNKKYQVTKINTGLLEFIGSTVLYFKGRLHPCRLAELYADLPGVRHAEPNGRIGDSPNIYPRQTGDGITYLFRDAWGDCPSGCIYSEYWYFVFEEKQPILIGHWAPHEDPQEPDWWNEAKENIEQFRE